MRRLAAAVLAALAASACTAPYPDTGPEAWAFCGVHPDDPAAYAKVSTLSATAGIDATFGPCLPPDWSTYTPATPGPRYADVNTYRRLVDLNALVGMTTVVYDARVWSDDPAVRGQALRYWRSRLVHIEAWDMGDEFDPTSLGWQVLIDRWTIVLEHITPTTGVRPFTNHLGGQGISDVALADIPEQATLYSFDAYGEGPGGEPQGIFDMAAHMEWRVDHLKCAVNALPHGAFRPNRAKLVLQMRMARDVGCDSFLVFGGDMPIGTAGFVEPSLVFSDGTPTPLAEAVRDGAS